MPEHKYASEQGPNFLDSFDLLRRVVRVPANAILALVDAALFNPIVGNADAHGKNFSLLYGTDGLRLAPLYDLLCTSIFPEVHARLAMRMGGAGRLEDFTPETLGDFAAQAGVAAPYVRRRCLELARKVGPAMDRVARRLAAEGFATRTIDDLIAHIRERNEALLAVAAISGPKFLARFDHLIKTDQFDVLAEEVRAFRARQPAISRYVAARLANRIFEIHPAFQDEAARLISWQATEPIWREAIENFATDRERLGGTVRAALESLRMFEPRVVDAVAP